MSMVYRVPIEVVQSSQRRDYVTYAQSVRQRCMSHSWNFCPDFGYHPRKTFPTVTFPAILRKFRARVFLIAITFSSMSFPVGNYRNSDGKSRRSTRRNVISSWNYRLSSETKNRRRIALPSLIKIQFLSTKYLTDPRIARDTIVFQNIRYSKSYGILY